MSYSRIAAPSRARFVFSVVVAILGVALIAVAAGLTAALTSAALAPPMAAGRPWPADLSRRASEGLIFLFGGAVAYATPVLAALLAAHCLVRKPSTWLRPVMRVLGATLLLGSLCALSTLLVSQWGRSPSQVFYWGGAVGAFLTLPEGIGLARALGPVGATLLFSGLLLLAATLVAQFMLRDLFSSVPRMREVCASSRDSIRRVFAGLNGNGAAKPDNAAAEPPSGQSRLAALGGGLWDFLVERPVQAIDDWLFERPQGPGASGTPTLRILDKTGATTPPGKPESAPLRFQLDEDAAPALVGRRGRRSPSPDDFLEPAARVSRPGAKQEEMELFPREYEIPPLDLLNPPPKTRAKISNEEILETSARLIQTLAEFSVEAHVTEVVQGPVVTRFELQPAPGVRVNRIAALEREIAMTLRAEHVRILAPIPGKAAIGVEVPNKKTNAVYLSEILMADGFQSHSSPLAFGLGKDITGEPVVADLAEMPHLLIAGATGAGKSVSVNSIILSMLMRITPDQVKFIMVDPKRVELSNYQGIPHLLAPVVVDPRKAAGALSWVVQRMEQRYRQLEQLHVRNIAAYNTVVRDARDNGKALRSDFEPMPYIVVVVDELADLMIVARSEVEESIQRLAQMSRAVGIHLILATQRPSVNVITGVIKANLPYRIAFRVSSKVDSRTILDSNGAEALIGKGDMLYSPGSGRLLRIQGSYVSDVEVERVADMLREQGEPRYEKEDFAAARASNRNGPSADPDFQEGGDAEAPGLTDDLYLRAVQIVLEARQASVSLIQRRLKIGYARAGRLMDLMEQGGIVGPYQGSKPRDLLVNPDEHLAQMESDGLIVRSAAFHREDEEQN